MELVTFSGLMWTMLPSGTNFNCCFLANLTLLYNKAGFMVNATWSAVTWLASMALCRFAKQFGAAVQVGQEFMATLAHMDFKRPGNMFPLARMAAWATMVTSSHKATDGLAKILTVTDVQKLKSQSSMAMTEEAELVLQDAWKTMGELIQAAEGPNQKAQESHYQKALESWQSGPCFSSAKSKSIPKKASLGPPCQKSLSNSPQIAEVQRPTKFLHLLSQKLKPVKSKIC